MVLTINLVFSVTAAFIGSYCWEMSSTIEPTGKEFGLRITNTFNQTIPSGFQVLCVTDRGDGTYHFTQQNHSTKTVWTFELSYDTFGCYNVSIECFNDTRAFNKSDNIYIWSALKRLYFIPGRIQNLFRSQRAGVGTLKT